MTGTALRMPLYLLLSLLLHLASAQVTYYIRPTLDSPCPYNGCLTLSQYGGQTHSYSSLDNLTLVFLPGEHVPHNVTIFDGNLFSLRLLGNQSFLPNITSKIRCNQSPAFAMVDIPKVEIKALAFEFCGRIDSSSSSHLELPFDLKATSHVVPAISALLVGQLELIACSMEQNHLPLFIYRSKSLLRDSKFENNKGAVYGGAVLVQSSTVTFEGHCLFEENEAIENGGGIFASSSELIFKGQITFTGNSAGSSGGAIGAFNSIIVFECTPPRIVSPTLSTCADFHHLFAENEAGFGGGMALINSTLRQKEGILKFVGNWAYHVGGGVLCQWTLVALDSTALFYNNIALGIGGAVAILLSHWNSSTISMANNTAAAGGAVVSTESSLRLGANFTENVQDCIGLPEDCSHLCDCDVSHTGEYHTMIVRNSATTAGGGFLVTNTTLDIIGNSCFERNHVTGNISHGGGIYAKDSVLSFTMQTVFLKNSAEVGGAIKVDRSEIFGMCFKVFNNHAIKGGGITANRSKLYFVERSEFIDNSAALLGGGIYTDQHNKLNFYSQTIFINNSALAGGGIAAATRNSLKFSGLAIFMNNVAVNGGGIFGVFIQLILFGKYVFTGNNGGFHGGGMYLIASNLLSHESGNFTDNRAAAGGAICLTSSTIRLQSNGTKLLRNEALHGGAIQAMNCKLQLVGEFDFDNNQATQGGAIFVQDKSDLSISGTSSFHNNVANPGGYNGYGGYGGGILALRSRVSLRGQTYFSNNSAFYGGGMAIAQHNPNYNLFIEPSTSIYFLGNRALKHGGGIMVEDLTFSYCGYESFGDELCFFQVCDMNSQSCSYEIPAYHQFIHEHNIYIVFKGNTAGDGGNAVYGGTLEKCRLYGNQPIQGLTINSISSLSGLEAIAILTRTTAEELNRESTNISSDPLRVCICNRLRPNCSQMLLSYRAYPGETLSFSVVAVGQLNGVVTGVVRADFEDPYGNLLEHFTQSTHIDCTTVSHSTFTRGDLTYATLRLLAMGPCVTSVEQLSINISFISCPEGFAMSTSGRCGCDQRLQKYTNSCDINTRTLTRRTNIYVGFDSQSGGLILHPHCPFDYCKLETVFFTLNTTDLQCADGRSGTLCGACKSGLSLNLQSSGCSNCSNIYILLFIPFAIAGILLVIFLFICKVTVAAGTTSGLIFYANVLAVNRSVFFPSGETNILTVFIAWLNLDLGIETCFISGMDTYTRTWMQFVFPLYIWILVGLIAIASRYSMKFARIIGPTNPISMLATLFLLSYTKLLRTIIATFSFTTLDYPNDRRVTVWVYNGNIGYLEDKHIPLFLAGLLAFLFLFLPYTLLLLFGQCIEAGSNHRLLSWANNPKVRSFLDAYHAPYKNRHRYWTGLLLLLRFVLFIISAVIDINSPRDPSVNLLVLGTVCAGLTILLSNTGSVYQNWYNNALESSFILNLAILALASYQVKVEGGNQAAVVYTSVSVAFATFLGIIAYHVVQQVLGSRMWRLSLGPKLQQFREKFSNPRQHRDNPIAMSVTAPPATVTTTFVDLREPLIDSNRL